MSLCCSAAVESTGAAKAEAQSRAEAARIQGEAAVNEAKLKAEAQRIEAVRILSLCCVCMVESVLHCIILIGTQPVVCVCVCVWGLLF